MAPKVSVTLQRNGVDCVVAALGDRTGNFLLKKAMRTFDDGDPVALCTPDGRMIDLDATLDEIILMSSTLNVLYEGEGGGGAEPEPEPEPVRNNRGGGGGGGRGGGRAAPTSSGNFYIAIANLRVREDADKNAEVIDDIPKTETIEVLEEKGDWFRIKIESGNKSGWVLSRNKARALVEKTDPPAGYSASAAAYEEPEPEPVVAKKATPKPKPKAAPPAPSNGSFYKSLANMNVREAPDGSADSVFDIRKNEVLKVLEVNGDWFRISLRGRDDVWIKSRTKVKSLVEEMDPTSGNTIWTQQEEGAPSLEVDEEEKKKKEAEEKKKEAAKKAQEEAAAAKSKGAGGGGSSAPSSVAVDGDFYTARVSCRVREIGDPDGEIITDLERGQFAKVVEEKGDWVRIERNDPDGNSIPAWVLRRNKRAELLIPAADPKDAGQRWFEQEKARLDAFQPEEKKEEPKKEEPKKGGGGFGGGGGKKEEEPQEFDLPPPPPKKKVTPPPVAAAPKAEAAPAKVAASGDVFWTCLSAGRCRDEPNSSGEVLGELSKNDIVKMLAQQGDWIQVTNVWSDKGGDAWLMFQNKKGKQLAEQSSDQGEASSKWNEQKAAIKAARDAVENGEEPPPPPAGGGGFGGGGGFESGGFGKKEISEEEKELLAIMKGFGSNTFAGEEGGGGENPPPAAAPAKPKPALKPKTPTKPKTPKKEKEAAPAAASPPPAAPKPKPAASQPAGPVSFDVQKPVAGEFWEALAAGRVRDENSSSGEVVGELKKGDIVNCIKKDGDWISIQNVWDNKPEAWLMYQNKKGKQMAQPAGDQGSASASWTEQQQAIKAAIAAAENGEDLPPPPADGGGGFGGGGGGGFGAKKELTDEEKELLAMMKGFGSNTFAGEEGGGGENPPPAAAPADKPKPASKPKPAAKPKPAPGPPVGEDDEAALLAMLKGVGNESPGEGGEPKEDNRTIEEKCEDTNPANRKNAYTDLAKLMEDAKDGNDDIFANKAELIENIAKEKNANAFVVGIEVLTHYFTKYEGQDGSDVALLVAPEIIRSGFKQAKAKVIASCRDLLVKILLACSNPKEMIEIIFTGLAMDGPKHSVESCKTLTDCIKNFGIFVLPLKKIAGKCIELLDKPDKKLNEAAQKLLLELTKWMGKPCLEFAISKLNDKDKAAFLKKIDENDKKPSEMLPILKLRHPNKKVDYEFDEDFNLIIDLVEPNDLLANLKKTDYSTKVKSVKWNEKVEAFDMIIAACGSPPKLLPGDISHIIDTLRDGMNDKMVAVAIAAVNTIGVVADGMGGEFKQYGKSLASDFIGRMKEKKLVEPGIGSMGKMYGRSLTIHDVFSNIHNTVFPTKGKVVPPHTMIGVLSFITNSVSKHNISLSSTETDEICALGYDIIVKVSDPKVKGAGVEMMIALLLREKVQDPKKTPVAKTLAPLADSKDSGQRMVFKKINEAADPDAAAKAADAKKPAAKGGDKKEKKEKKDGDKGDKKKDDKKKSGGGGGDDSVTTKLDMSDDDALTLLEKLPVPDLDSLVKTLGGTEWAARKEACEKLGSTNYKGKVHVYSPGVVTILQSKTKKFTDKNANVMKGVFTGIENMAKQSTAESSFDKGSANVMIAIGIEKLQDKKIAPAVRSMLMSLSESISPSFVIKTAIKNIALQKSPVAHQECSLWMIDMVSDFGVVACGEKVVGEYGMSEFENARVTLKDPKTKTNVITMLGVCYKQKGPAFVKKSLKNMDKNLTGPAEAEFEKVGFDAKSAGATITKKALDVEEDAGGGGGGEDRIDLSKTLDKDILDKLGNADNKKWKDRKEAMDKVIAACSGESLIVNNFVKDLSKALAKCLSDLQLNNKPLAANALGELLSGLPPQERDATLKGVIKPLMLACADGKDTMREATITAIDKGCCYEDKADQKALVVAMGGFHGKESGLVKPVARSVLLTWAVKRFPELKIGTDMKAIIPQLLDCMNDKDSKVRANADLVVGIMVSKKAASQSDILKGMDKLSASAQRSTKERLQSIFDSTEIESASAPSSSAAPAAKESYEEEPESHSAGGGDGGGGGGGDFGLLPNPHKEKREENSWKVRWPSPPAEDLPGSKESDMLKSEWEKYISKDKITAFFPKKLGSMDCGNNGIEIIYEVIQHNDDLFIDHLDLIFKWFTLRLSEREMMPTLVRMLEVISICLQNLHARGYELLDFEGAILIPYILEKSGSNKDRITSSFKNIMETISELYPIKKYTSLLVKGTKSKNAKTQSNVLIELARIIELHGVDCIGPKNYVTVVKLIDSKDKDVRNAALDCMVSGYLYLGSDLYSYIGGNDVISNKSKDLIEARIKVSGKKSLRDPSPGHNPLNNDDNAQPVAKAGVKEKLSPPARSRVESPPVQQEAPPPQPISEAVSTASFGDEILARLDALLSAQQPLDKNSDVYLEGKDVIKVVHSLASGAEPTQFAFNRSTLVSHANAVISKLSVCLNLSFICAEAQGDSDVDVHNTGAGGIDVQLLSVCLAALMALFRLPELCREVKPPPLRDMLATTCSRLLDDRLAATRGPYAATAAQVIKALNKISIQSAIQAPRSSSLSALLYLFAHPVTPSPQSSAKFATKITTIFSKLFNRILTEEIENVTGTPFNHVDLPTIMYALNDFFSVYSKREKGNGEVQYDAAVGLLKRLVLHIGRDQIMSIVNNNLGPKQGKPLLNAISKEVPAEGRHRQTNAETLERQQSVSGFSDLGGADSTKQERLAQLKQKLRNSQDDTF